MTDKDYKRNWIFRSMRWIYHRLWYAINFMEILQMPFEIASIDETLDTLLENGCSIARFGEGNISGHAISPILPFSNIRTIWLSGYGRLLRLIIPES